MAVADGVHSSFCSPTIGAICISAPWVKSVVTWTCFFFNLSKLVSHASPAHATPSTESIVASWPFMSILNPVTSPSSPPAFLSIVIVSVVDSALFISSLTSMHFARSVSTLSKNGLMIVHITATAARTIRMSKTVDITCDCAFVFMFCKFF